jgi:SpoVK/Ycf46/Vps4 family AAA+-type ATPase
VIKDRLGKYGAVYLSVDIKESVEDILGNETKKELLDDFFKALIKYEEFTEQLKDTKLTPNLTVLLYGPPGTGKTSLTRGFAKKYNIPICIVESDRLVSPLLGDTIKNIRGVVELAADISKERGAFILFFDEIDAIGSERSNIHEVGEIKRAVISFLQVIDRINYEGVPLAIFGATNHQHQLDSAIWRRFTFHFEFDFPNYHLRKQIIESFVNKLKNAKIGVDDAIFSNLNNEYKEIQRIAKELENKLGHKISEFDDNILWEEISKKSKIDGLLKLTIGYSGSDIERGTRVALLKAISTEILTYDIFFNSLRLVGGTATHVERQDVLSSTKVIANRSKVSEEERKSLPSPPEI